jgi:REP-associated tyrosine transposase
MARPLRIEFEGALYHVTSRGDERKAVFFDDADRAAFLKILGDVVGRFGWLCHAYCLMTNHYHLLIETPNANLSRGMRHLNGVYTQQFNRVHERVGHVMQGRFKSILVEKDSYLLELARYVVLNPVRARMVRSVRDWKWSSYRATAGQEAPFAFLTVEWLLSQFSKNPAEAVSQYRRFVRQGRGVEVWEGLRGGILMGSDHFIQELTPRLHEMKNQREIPRTQRLAARPSLDDLFSDVISNAERNQRIHEATRQHEYTLAQVQDHLGLHYSTISRIASRVENERVSKDKI